MKTTSKRSRRKRPPAAPSALPPWLEQWRRTGQPILLKVNDTEVYRLDDEGSIERLAHLVGRLESITAIREGLDEVNRGKTISLEEFEAKARSKHGLPD